MRSRSLLITLLTVSTLACDGSFLPAGPSQDVLLDGPIDGLNTGQSGIHARGDGEFGRQFTALDGLGPIFVASSCESCHAGDGKGHPLFSLTRFGRFTNGMFDPMTEEGGPQLQQRAIMGYLGELLPGGATAVARFNPPSVGGLGFLEAVDDDAIFAMADPNDANGDGISGVVSLIDSSEFIANASATAIAAGSITTRGQVHDGKYVGRFGKKARTINLLHQTVFAYSEDMGLTTELAPLDLYNVQVGTQAEDNVPDPEVPNNILNAVVFYLRTLKAPPRRNADGAEVRAGERAFAEANCSGCHVTTLRTGRSDVPQLNNVEFHPFTDLLLHDMGPELDDGYTEGSATSAEWRTAPLWGIGVAERSQGGLAYYLHDGRARTLREAIRSHGGEAAGSRARFDAFKPATQTALLAYLRSL